MEFPHLKDTNFPHLNNVDVYAYHNEFDYSRWIIGTNIKLCNVLWSSDYNDVVKFEDDESRDFYFANLKDYYEIDLTSNSQTVPDGRIKFPIPYDVMARYNYAVVTIPKMPGDSPYINYEDSEAGIRTWYFFIDSIEYRAPNTTLANVTLDAWTQYINDVEIKYMYLERGHAPVAATNVDTYLANPIENNEYLLTPDFTPSTSNIVRSAKYIPIGNGLKYVVVASTIAPYQLANMGTITQDSQYSNSLPTFSDIAGQRDGYQLQVNNYGIGDGYDYSNLKVPCDYTAANGARVPNGLNTYAIRANECFGDEGEGMFFYDVMKSCPQFMRSIEGCFVVDEEMIRDIEPESTYTVAGHTIRWVRGTETITQFDNLTKEEFGFPAKYERFAKLYTYPYSSMEITDNAGHTATVRIENLSNRRYMHNIAQLTFPFTNIRTFFSGINGSGSQTYVWKNLVDYESELLMPNSDWYEFCFDNDIPFYALYMDGEAQWMLENFNSAVRGGKAQDLATYHAAARSANTQMQNAVDFDSMIKSNANASAATANANVHNATTTSATNNQEDRDFNTLKVNKECHYANLLNADEITHNNSVTGFKNNMIQESTNIENERTSIVSSNTASGTMATSMVSGAASILSAPTEGVDAIAGIAGGIGQMINGTINATVIANNATATINANHAMSEELKSNNRLMTQEDNSMATIRNNLFNGPFEEETGGSNREFNRIINEHIQEINDNLNTLNNTNADNIKKTSDSNALRTQQTNDNNAGYTRGSAIDNAQEHLRANVLDKQMRILDARIKSAIHVTNSGGDSKPDYMRTRGIQIKIKTMSNSEIAEVGDWFTRYGYSVNRIWDISQSGMCPMKHFCYWKTNDIWIDDRKSSNNDIEMIIQSIFNRGVTVWNNPNEIGRINVYDN